MGRTRVVAVLREFWFWFLFLLLFKRDKEFHDLLLVSCIAVLK